MRGKVVVHLNVIVDAGTTPANAGKNPSVRLPCRRGWDHPRVCGEKLSKGLFFVLVEGSPPRVRGKGDFLCQPADTVGITPACAGKGST